MQLKVEHLDLAIPTVDRKVTKLDQFRHNYYFTNQFKHNIHSDNSQLNTTVDMLIASGLNLEQEDKYLTEINNHIHENIISKLNILKELFYNIEYVNNQSNDVIKTIGERKDISLCHNILINLDKKYKEIKHFSEELKQIVIT